MRSKNKIRDRKVAYSYTLETKSMENGKKDRYRNVGMKRRISKLSGAAKHFTLYIDIIIDLYSIYYKKRYVYIYINMRKWSR